MMAEGVSVSELSKHITTTSGEVVKMPAGQLQIAISEYIIPRGTSLPVYKHPYPRHDYLFSETLEVINVETGHSVMFYAQIFIAEDVNLWHKAQSTGDKPVELLVIYLVRPGKGNAVRRDAL